MPARKIQTPLPNQASEEITTSSKKNNEYIEIRLPKVRFADTPLSPLWVILLIIFAFLLGMTTTKLQYLEKNGTTTQTTGQAGAPAQTATKDDVKKWAKEIGLNTGKFNQCLDSEKYKDNIDKDIKDAVAAKAQATPTFYINGQRVVGALPFASLKAIIDKELAYSSTPQRGALIPAVFAQEEGPQQGAGEPTSPLSPTPEIFTVDKGHLPALGKENAPVTIVEFSDFECPFCRRHYEEAHQQLKKEYIDKGKAVLYYRHLPLTSLHPMAQTFALASECANEQGKFWQMHDKIFKEQG